MPALELSLYYRGGGGGGGFAGQCFFQSHGRVKSLCIHYFNHFTGQDCLRPDASEDRRIPLQNNPSLPRLPRQTQAIVTSYQFFCCGDVTNWQAFVSPLNSDHNITLQIWRPSAGEEEGCFMLVGEMSLLEVRDSNQDSSRSRGIRTGNTISVRPGDVVGYYQNTICRQGISRQGEGVQLDNSVTDVQVWYHTETVEEPLVVGPSRCVHRVGQEGQLSSLTLAAPAISVEICKCTCDTKNLC